ncbi:MAG: cytochrome c oxidase accessory protein CcoG [Bdellovibrionota bacterium]
MSQLGKYEYTNSLHADGHRRILYPSEVRGGFQKLKKIIHPLMILNFLVLPLLRIGDDRLLLIDIQHRTFFIFGFSFNAQDIYLMFFLVTGLAFTLFFITALVGRIFCGWACPQTVFLEGIYRRVERWIEGSQANYFKNRSKKNATYWRNMGLKYIAYILISFLLAHFIVLYFVRLHVYQEMWLGNVSSHPVVFAWIMFLTFLLTFNYGWFREQLCLVICPYGRLQSVLMDDDSLLIGYDPNRGEPRGKLKDPNRGQCIDCNRCVEVCPTGIDIRNGMQMECIGCANCIDACDEIMLKIGQPKGLVRYDSYNGLTQQKKTILRPRIYVYMVLLAIGAIVSTKMISKRTSFEANLLRAKGAPYLLLEKTIRNQYEIHLFNKDRFDRTFTIKPIPIDGVRFTIPIQKLTIKKLRDQTVPVFVEMDKDRFEKSFDIEVLIQHENGEKIMETVVFTGP